MTKKSRPIKSGFFSRGVAASIAGIRAGGALAIDNALQKAKGNIDDTPSAFAQREAERFVNELGKLKGTYVKIGQLMALFGEHVLPLALTQALHQLNDNTAPLHWSLLEPDVRKKLGARFEELDIETNALAAASLAQVHRATIRKTGEHICLKIQYPGLADVIEEDFDAVIRMLEVARWLNRSGDLEDWLTAMRSHLRNEIDYLREASLTQKTAAYLAEYSSITDQEEIAALHVPTIHSDYSSDTIIAMEYIEGQSLADINIKTLPLERRNALAKAMLDLFFKEVYCWGIIQTDPNFGNYIIQLASNNENAESTKDILTLLDFGSTIEMKQDDLKHLQQLISGGQHGDRQRVAKSLLGLGWLKSDASEQAHQLFTDFCLHLLEPLRAPDQLPAEHLNANGQYCWANSQLVQRAGKKGAKHARSRHFKPPSSDFTLIARKLTGVFTFIVVLEAEFNAFNLVKKYIEVSDNQS